MQESPIIRFMNRTGRPLYFTGSDGFEPQEIDPKPGARINSNTFFDVLQIDRSKHEGPFQAMFYIGLSESSRDFTCYLNWDGANETRTLGAYNGDGFGPDPLLYEPYGQVLRAFPDKDLLCIWQWQIIALYESLDAYRRLLPILDSAAFAGNIYFMKYALPKMVLGVVVRGADGKFASAVQGWVEPDETKIEPCRKNVVPGETNVEPATANVVPDADTLIPIASITKTFTGHLLAKLVASRQVHFTDRVRQNDRIRLIDLATHTSGLPREVEPDIVLNPKEETTLPRVLFPPGTGALYSNVGFNVLGREIYRLCGNDDPDYYALLKREVLTPAGLTATSFDAPVAWEPGASDLEVNAFYGHQADRSPWEGPPHDRTPRGASGLYSTPGDILKWLEWHLAAGGGEDAVETEARLLNHAAYVQRDGLSPVFGLDESGHMDAMGLGWVVMMPKGDRPLILQKAGGTTGVFSFVAFSPARGIGFFMSIDQFNVGAGTEMPELIADLIAGSAPR